MDNNVLFVLMFFFLVGIFMVFGVVVVFVLKRKNEKIIIVVLGFLVGVMICVLFIDLFFYVEIILMNYYGKLYGVLLIMFYMLIGMIFVMLIDKLILYELYKINIIDKKYLRLFRVGIVFMIVIILYNFLEGVVIFMFSY